MRDHVMLSEMWRPGDVRAYKVHFARWNGDSQPLQALARSIDEWRNWQEWKPSNNAFNRPFVFSLAQTPGAMITGCSAASGRCSERNIAMMAEITTESNSPTN